MIFISNNTTKHKTLPNIKAFDLKLEYLHTRYKRNNKEILNNTVIAVAIALNVFLLELGLTLFFIVFLLS